MKQFILFLLLLITAGTMQAQGRFSSQELSINGFRNPSIGLEYRFHQFSGHAGYYPTNFTAGVTTEFLRAGLSFWLLPVGQKEIPSSFYLGVSYLRGQTRAYKDKNALAFEAGFRWMIWRGLHFRIGVIALTAEGQDLKINPTPGLSYAFQF